MAKVQVTVVGKPYRGNPVGSVLTMSEREVRILKYLKCVGDPPPAGQYQTRVITAQTPPPPPAGPVYVYKGIVLDGKPIEELRSMADTLGIDYHHNAGALKISQAIVDSAK